MDVVVERCCGLDLHKKTVVACLRTPEGEQVRRFGTMTRELLRLLEWLQRERGRCWRWRARAATGSRSTTCWKDRGWSRCWSTQRI